MLYQTEGASLARAREVFEYRRKMECCNREDIDYRGLSQELMSLLERDRCQTSILVQVATYLVD